MLTDILLVLVIGLQGVTLWRSLYPITHCGFVPPKNQAPAVPITGSPPLVEPRSRLSSKEALARIKSARKSITAQVCKDGTLTYIKH